MASIYSIKQDLSDLIREESGQGMVEYSLIIALLVLVLIVTLKLFSSSVIDMYEHDILTVIDGVLETVTGS